MSPGVVQVTLERKEKEKRQQAADDVEELVHQIPHPQQLHGNPTLKLTFVTCVFCAAVT